MKDFAILKFLDRFRLLFMKGGIDYDIMRKILQMKLTLDDRRVPTALMNNKNADGKSSYRKGLIMYGLIGVFIAIVMIFPYPLFFKMNLVFGIVVFMVMTTMISDFSAVLLDIRDKNILLPRPVNPKTINAAKLIHILFYLATITITIAGPALLAGTFIYGTRFFFIFLMELALICSFVVFITSILYSAILGFFDGEKLKDIINYFQILLSVFMVAAYQFMGRIFTIINLNIQFTPKWWNYLIPSAWFAAPFELFIGNNQAADIIGLGATGIIIPAAALVIYLTAVIPHFERNLQKLNNNSGGKNKISERKEKRKLARAKWICGNKLESCFYRFTRNMLANERKLKLRLFPNLALAVVLPLVFLSNYITKGISVEKFLAEVSSSKLYLFIYVSIGLLAGLLQLLGISEQYRGAWIYRALPIASPTSVLKGAVKAFFLKYILPVYMLVCLIFFAIYGTMIIPDMILIFFNMLIVLLFLFRISGKEMPFYKDYQYTQNGSNIGAVFLSFLICGVLAAIHLIVSSVTFGVTLNLVVSILLTILLWRISFKITWKDVLTGSS